MYRQRDEAGGFINGTSVWPHYGIGCATFVVDAPGSGKIPLVPNYVQSRHHGRWLPRNFRGADIRLEVALQALQDGFSLTKIIQKTVWQLEKYVIAQILKSTQGNKAETARILKVDYKTLYRKIDKYFNQLP